MFLNLYITKKKKKVTLTQYLLYAGTILNTFCMFTNLIIARSPWIGTFFPSYRWGKTKAQDHTISLSIYHFPEGPFLLALWAPLISFVAFTLSILILTLPRFCLFGPHLTLQNLHKVIPPHGSILMNSYPGCTTGTTNTTGLKLNSSAPSLFLLLICWSVSQNGSSFSQ